MGTGCFQLRLCPTLLRHAKMYREPIRCCSRGIDGVVRNVGDGARAGHGYGGCRTGRAVFRAGLSANENRCPSTFSSAAASRLRGMSTERPHLGLLSQTRGETNQHHHPARVRTGQEPNISAPMRDKRHCFNRSRCPGPSKKGFLGPLPDRQPPHPPIQAPIVRRARPATRHTSVNGLALECCPSAASPPLRPNPTVHSEV